MVKVITPPATEPVTLNDFKVWMQCLNITPEQEPMALSLLKAGREEAEAYQNTAYCEQTLQIAPENLSGAIVLPRPPFLELKSVTAYLQDGMEQDITDQCLIYTTVPPATLYLPTLSAPLRTVDPVLIIYTAGYGVVPEKVRQAILLYASWSWTHRSGGEPVPAAFYNLLSKGRVVPV